MKRLIFFSLLLCSITAAEDRPNIILILIDDQDWSSIGAFGGDTYTPHLDRMATEGMKFTQAYVSSGVCTPSRYSFATGRYAGNVLVGGVIGLGVDGFTGATKDLVPNPIQVTLEKIEIEVEKSSTEDRLGNLQKLHESGDISEEEYQEARKKIIGDV